jgi:hypothetical protein
LIERANEVQTHIKVLSFEYLFKPVARKSPGELEQLDSKLRNREILEFHRRFSSKEGLAPERLWQSIQPRTLLVCVAKQFVNYQCDILTHFSLRLFEIERVDCCIDYDGHHQKPFVTL